MQSGDLLIYVGCVLGSLIIYYIITQWVHQIHKRNRYLKAQIDLLAKIAEKHGVPKDDIDGVINTAEIKQTPFGL